MSSSLRALWTTASSQLLRDPVRLPYHATSRVQEQQMRNARVQQRWYHVSSSRQHADSSTAYEPPVALDFSDSEVGTSDDTIFHLSSGSNRAGVAVIRISGLCLCEHLLLYSLPASRDGLHLCAGSQAVQAFLSMTRRKAPPKPRMATLCTLHAITPPSATVPTTSSTMHEQSEQSHSSVSTPGSEDIIDSQVWVRSHELATPAMWSMHTH